MLIFPKEKWHPFTCFCEAKTVHHLFFCEAKKGPFLPVWQKKVLRSKMNVAKGKIRNLIKKLGKVALVKNYSFSKIVRWGWDSNPGSQGEHA